MAMDRRRVTSGYFPLRDAIDRLFETSFIAPQGLASGHMGFPTAGVRATDDDVVIDLAVAGARPEDINISVTGDTVTISGEIKREQHQHKGQVYVDEMYHGQFQRSFSLPFPVDADGANATFDNGVLELTLPKSEAVRPRRIQVNRGNVIEGQSSHSQGDVQRETVPVSGDGAS